MTSIEARKLTKRYGAKVAVDQGHATIGGVAYRDLPWPLLTVGALFEAKAVHKGRTPYHHLLTLAQTVLAGQGAQVTPDGVGALIVTGLQAPRIAERAAAQGLVLYELAPQQASLEDAFMQLTQDSIEYDGASR